MFGLGRVGMLRLPVIAAAACVTVLYVAVPASPGQASGFGPRSSHPIRSGAEASALPFGAISNGCGSPGGLFEYGRIGLGAGCSDASRLRGL